MKVVKVHEAKTHFSRLLAEVEAGEEIVVQRGDRAVAKLVPLPVSRTRKAGRYAGQFSMTDDFDELPPEFDEFLG